MEALDHLDDLLAGLDALPALAPAANSPSSSFWVDPLSDGSHWDLPPWGILPPSPAQPVAAAAAPSHAHPLPDSLARHLPERAEEPAPRQMPPPSPPPPQLVRPPPAAAPSAAAAPAADDLAVREAQRRALNLGPFGGAADGARRALGRRLGAAFPLPGIAGAGAGADGPLPPAAADAVAAAILAERDTLPAPGPALSAVLRPTLRAPARKPRSPIAKPRRAAHPHTRRAPGPAPCAAVAAAVAGLDAALFCPF